MESGGDGVAEEKVWTEVGVESESELAPVIPWPRALGPLGHPRTQEVGWLPSTHGTATARVTCLSPCGQFALGSFTPRKPTGHKRSLLITPPAS